MDLVVVMEVVAGVVLQVVVKMVTIGDGRNGGAWASRAATFGRRVAARPASYGRVVWPIRFSFSCGVYWYLVCEFWIGLRIYRFVFRSVIERFPS